jgi:hypothetical protein
MLTALNHLPPGARVAALAEVKGILDDLSKTDGQFQNLGNPPSLGKLLSSGSKELRRLVHKAAKHRTLEWAKSHLEECIELDEMRTKMESIEKSFRDLDHEMADLLAFQSKLNESTRKRREEPIELETPEQDSKTKSWTEATEAIEIVTTTYHKARRHLMNPWRILWSNYRFEIKMGARSVARGTITILAGMVIFLVAGLAHRLPVLNWYAAFIAVPLAVAVIELRAHRWVEARLHIWERRDMHVLTHALAKVRIVAAVDNALAEWAIKPLKKCGDSPN